MIRVLYFSLLREKLGRSEEEIEFSGSVRELKELLAERYPEARSLIRAVRVAVNEEYVSGDRRLEGGERVALIPPVSGG